MNDRVVQPRRFTVWLSIGIVLPMLGAASSRALPEPYALIVGLALCAAGMVALLLGWRARYRGPG